MKQLEARSLSHLKETTAIELVSEALDQLEKHAIDIAPWPAFDAVPKAAFSIAHNAQCIFLKYYLEDTVLKAACFRTDDPVHKDNCVEFFIAFENDEAYYNLELNAVGTCKLNFGKSRHDRIMAAEVLVRQIRYLSLIKNNDGIIQWQLCLILPMEVFFKHQLPLLSGQICHANFYKCGDELPTPHFLCWNKIDTPEPDFHVRHCFGEVRFL